MDRRRYLALINDEPITLSRKEFELLGYLASDPGRVFTKGQIMAEVWPDYYDVGLTNTTRTLDSHLSRIRVKLRNAGLPDAIHVRWGVGWSLEVAA